MKIRAMRIISIITVLFGLTGCAPVAFYQKGRLADPIMSMDSDPSHMHFIQKSTYSREGSVGGIGTGAGGGCGCY